MRTTINSYINNSVSHFSLWLLLSTILFAQNLTAKANNASLTLQEISLFKIEAASILTPKFRTTGLIGKFLP